MRFHHAVAKLVIICSVLMLAIGLSAVHVQAEAGKDGGSANDWIKQQSSTDKTPGATDTQPLQSDPNELQVNTPGSGWTFLLQVVFALGLVIVLIYLVLRFLASRQLGGASQTGAIKVVGAIPVGNGKSVQIAMIGDSLYVLGVGNEITLLRHIPAGDEMDVILAEAEMKSTPRKLEDWMALFKRNKQAHYVSAGEPQDSVKSFDEVLDQEWKSVSTEANPSLYDSEAARDKGERL